MIPNRSEMNRVFRADLYSFVKGAFRELEPGTTFASAPYLKVLCHALMEVELGNTTRLIVNMPPRTLKSLVTSVIWVAWMLMRNPSKKIAIICHNDNLALDFALKCKCLVESDWYRALAPDVRIQPGRDRVKDFGTVAGGGVYAASIEGGITGHGFNVIILDDPQSAQDAGSQAERERVKALFDNVIRSRLDDPVRGAFVVVQQRLHEDDLSGYLLSRGGWTHLCIPLVALEQTTYMMGQQTWVRPPSDILCPERLPVHEIEVLQAQLGPQVYGTQYQQAPSSVQGEIIKPEHLKSVLEVPRSATAIFVSVDTAAKNSPTSDYTVFMLTATDYTRHYIFDVIRERLDVGQMRDVALRLYEKYRFEKFLIEDSASGPSLHTLLLENGKRPELINVGSRDKQTRLQDHMHLFVEGRVYIVGDAPWTAIFRKEAESFPLAKYDDQVDAMTLYFEHFAKKSAVKPCILGTSSRMERGLPFSRPPAKGDNPMRPRTGFLGPRRFF
jgi:predicted phage terminase large subunit-like protein